MTHQENRGEVSVTRRAGVRTSAVVAILCPKAWGVRNVVHSGMIGHIQARGIRPYLLTPGDDVAHAGNDWRTSAPRAELLPAPVIGSQRGLSFWNELVYASFSRRHGVNFRRIFGRWSRRNDGPWMTARNSAIELLSRVGCGEPFYSWHIRQRDRHLWRTRDLRGVTRQLQDLQPSLLVSTNSQFSVEHPYLFVARDLGIRTLGCIQSFDNLTTRGVLPVFDYYAVWNERMRDQVLRFYPDRNPTTIQITGTPQFDFHVRPECRWSREVTLQRLGLQPRDRYVVYAPGGFPTEAELLTAMSRRFAATPELQSHRIVVRPHPVDECGRWERAIAQDRRLVLNWPWKITPGVAWDAPTVVRFSDQTRLISTLLHADACLNSASTMSLDAAAVGTPVVCIGFAGQRGGPEDCLVLDAHFVTHYRPITESGGVRPHRVRSRNLKFPFLQ